MDGTASDCYGPRRLGKKMINVREINGDKQLVYPFFFESQYCYRLIELLLIISLTIE
jgi:hypothetical protein